MGGEIGVRSTPGAGIDVLVHGAVSETAGRRARRSRCPRPPSTDAGCSSSTTTRPTAWCCTISWRAGASRTTRSAGGAEALVALRDAAADGRPFELAILDRQMPGMDGLMLARAIKREPAIADVRLIMMTSLGDIGDADELAAAGVIVCLTKPVKQAQVRECLSRALAQPVGAPIAPRRIGALDAGPARHARPRAHRRRQHRQSEGRAAAASTAGLFRRRRRQRRRSGGSAERGFPTTSC